MRSPSRVATGGVLPPLDCLVSPAGLIHPLGGELASTAASRVDARSPAYEGEATACPSARVTAI